MLLFLATMTMVTLSDHIMVMWIAIEATTLASAPLIFTHRTRCLPGGHLEVCAHLLGGHRHGAAGLRCW